MHNTQDQRPFWDLPKAGFISRWQRAFIIAGLASLGLFGVYALWGSSDISHISDESPNSFGHFTTVDTSDKPFDAIIVDLWDSERIPVTKPIFIDSEGQTYRLQQDPIFQGGLGKRIAILDMDTRPFSKDGELLSSSDWTWPNVDHLSAGMTAHYQYAQIHGYDYMMIKAPKYKDRHDAWGKVIMMQYALQDHDFVLFMDSDAILAYPELPLEWLMNYWNINETISVALSCEPPIPRDRDSRGNPGQNTGFMILQNNAKTHELYKAWAECPGETRYPGCSKWKNEKLKEQTAFTEYVVYDPEFQPYIRIVPCTEANGYPEKYEETKCRGVFVRHHWLDKHLTRDLFQENVMRMWAKKLHRFYVDEGFREGSFIQDLTKKVLVGSEIMDDEFSEGLE